MSVLDKQTWPLCEGDCAERHDPADLVDGLCAECRKEVTGPDSRIIALAKLEALVRKALQAKGYRFETHLKAAERKLIVRTGAYHLIFTLHFSGHKGDFAISTNSIELTEVVAKCYDDVVYPHKWEVRSV